MKNRGAVVIDLMGETDELEKGEIKREDHACRCEVCHCENKTPLGYDGRAVKYDESLMLLQQAYVEPRGRRNSR